MSKARTFRNTLTRPLSEGRAWLRSGIARKLLVDYRHRGTNETDVFLASYPKSGNTWLRHLVTHLITGESTDWRTRLVQTSVIVGQHHSLKPSLTGGGRLIKTHESYRPEYARAVLMVRDVRDVIVSEFHYRQQFSGEFFNESGHFESFLARFLDGKTGSYGSWQEHTMSWLHSCTNEKGNLCLVRYEDLKQDTHGQLARVANFLQLEISAEQIEAAIADNTPAAMRTKEKIYRDSLGQQDRQFVRAAKSGGWEDWFTEESLLQLTRRAGEAMRACGYDGVTSEKSPSTPATASLTSSC